MKDKRKKQVKKQQQSERITRFIALSLLSVALVSLFFWQAQQWIMDPDTLPIKIVRIDGELKYLQKSELENAVSSKVSGGFFSIDLQQIKEKAQQLAWVDDVSVKRVWPEAVVMHIEEKVAIARWGKKRLVTAKGEIFLPPADMPGNLPLLQGADERVLELVNRYAEEQRRFSTLNLNVSELVVNDRGAWSIKFSNELKIAVGRHDVDGRLQRLARYLETIRQLKGMPESIDLRYQHGMAVFWKPAEKQNNEVSGEGAV